MSSTENITKNKLNGILLVLAIISIGINIVNCILNYTNKGLASIFYIMLSIFFLYQSKRTNIKNNIVFVGGIIFTAYLGMISIIFKYFNLNDTIEAIIYYLPIIIMLFLGGQLIGGSFNKRK